MKKNVNNVYLLLFLLYVKKKKKKKRGECGRQSRITHDEVKITKTYVYLLYAYPHVYNTSYINICACIYYVQYIVHSVIIARAGCVCTDETTTAAG